MSVLLRRGNTQNFLSPTWQEYMKKIENCIGCEAYASRCPYSLNPPELLRRNYEEYKEIIAGNIPLD